MYPMPLGSCKRDRERERDHEKIAHDQYLVLATLGPPLKKGQCPLGTRGQAEDLAAQNKLLTPQTSVLVPECKVLTR